MQWQVNADQFFVFFKLKLFTYFMLFILSWYFWRHTCTYTAQDAVYRYNTIQYNTTQIPTIIITTNFLKVPKTELGQMNDHVIPEIAIRFQLLNNANQVRSTHFSDKMHIHMFSYSIINNTIHIKYSCISFEKKMYFHCYHTLNVWWRLTLQSWVLLFVNAVINI